MSLGTLLTTPFPDPGSPAEEGVNDLFFDPSLVWDEVSQEYVSWETLQIRKAIRAEQERKEAAMAAAPVSPQPEATAIPGFTSPDVITPPGLIPVGAGDQVDGNLITPEQEAENIRLQGGITLEEPEDLALPRPDPFEESARIRQELGPEAEATVVSEPTRFEDEDPFERHLTPAIYRQAQVSQKIEGMRFGEAPSGVPGLEHEDVPWWLRPRMMPATQQALAARRFTEAGFPNIAEAVNSVPWRHLTPEDTSAHGGPAGVAIEERNVGLGSAPVPEHEGLHVFELLLPPEQREELRRRAAEELRRWFEPEHVDGWIQNDPVHLITIAFQMAPESLSPEFLEFVRGLKPDIPPWGAGNPAYDNWYENIREPRPEPPGEVQQPPPDERTNLRVEQRGTQFFVVSPDEELGPFAEDEAYELYDQMRFGGDEAARLAHRQKQEQFGQLRRPFFDNVNTVGLELDPGVQTFGPEGTTIFSDPMTQPAWVQLYNARQDLQKMGIDPSLTSLAVAKSMEESGLDFGFAAPGDFYDLTGTTLPFVSLEDPSFPTPEGGEREIAIHELLHIFEYYLTPEEQAEWQRIRAGLPAVQGQFAGTDFDPETHHPGGITAYFDYVVGFPRAVLSPDSPPVSLPPEVANFVNEKLPGVLERARIDREQRRGVDELPAAGGPGGVATGFGPADAESPLAEDEDTIPIDPYEKVTPERIAEMEKQGYIFDYDKNGLAVFRKAETPEELARAQMGTAIAQQTPDPLMALALAYDQYNVDIPVVSDVLRAVQAGAGTLGEAAGTVAFSPFMALEAVGIDSPVDPDFGGEAGRWLGEAIVPVGALDLLIEMLPGGFLAGDAAKSAAKSAARTGRSAMSELTRAAVNADPRVYRLGVMDDAIEPLADGSMAATYGAVLIKDPSGVRILGPDDPLLPGEKEYFHGTAVPFEGGLREGTFLTPERFTAEGYAQTSALMDARPAGPLRRLFAEEMGGGTVLPPGGFSEGDAVMELRNTLRNAEKIIQEREAIVKAGRGRQAGGIRAAFQAGEEAGLTGQDLARQATGGAKGRILPEEGLGIPISREASEALVDKAGAMLKAGEIQPFEFINIAKALRDMSEQGLTRGQARQLSKLTGIDETAFAPIVKVRKSIDEEKAAQRLIDRAEAGQVRAIKELQRQQDSAFKALKRAQEEALERGQLRAIREMFEEQGKALRARVQEDALEIARTRRYIAKTEADFQKNATQELQDATREAVKVRQQLDAFQPSPEMLEREARALMGDILAGANSAPIGGLGEDAINILKYYAENNRLRLDLIKDAGSIGRLAAGVRAQFTGDLADSFLTKLQYENAALVNALVTNGMDPTTAAKVGDLVEQAELLRRYPDATRKGGKLGDLPERVQRELDKLKAAGYAESIKGAERMVQRYKNIKFGLDAGVLGVHGMTALRRGGVPLLAGEINRLLTVLHLPHIKTHIMDSALDKATRNILDGNYRGTSFGVFEKDMGTILKYLPGIKKADPAIAEVLEKWNDFQFGTILGHVGDAAYEGHLVILDVLRMVTRSKKFDIMNPAVRGVAADYSNTVKSWARGALTSGRKSGESILLTSPSMTRAGVAHLLQISKLIRPDASVAERALAAGAIMSEAFWLLATGKFVNDHIGIADFIFDPRLPGFGTIVLPDTDEKGRHRVINVFPQSSVERAIARSFKAIMDDEEGELAEAWLRYFAGRGSPLGATALALGTAGAGYGPQGRFSKDLSVRDLGINIAPIPPVLMSVAEQIKGGAPDAVSTFLEFLGISEYDESESVALNRGRSQAIEALIEGGTIPPGLLQTGAKYSDLGPGERDLVDKWILENLPHLKKNMEEAQRERGSIFQKTRDDINRERAKTEALLQGNMTGLLSATSKEEAQRMAGEIERNWDEFKSYESRKYQEKAYSDATKGFDENNMDKLFGQWYALYDAARDHRTQVVNFDMLDATRQQFLDDLQSQDPALLSRFLFNLESIDRQEPPAVQMIKNVTRTLSDAGYYDMEEAQKTAYLRDNPQVNVDAWLVGSNSLHSAEAAEIALNMGLSRTVTLAGEPNTPITRENLPEYKRRDAIFRQFAAEIEFLNSIDTSTDRQARTKARANDGLLDYLYFLQAEPGDDGMIVAQNLQAVLRLIEQYGGRPDGVRPRASR